LVDGYTLTAVATALSDAVFRAKAVAIRTPIKKMRVQKNDFEGTTHDSW
jgi:hypothetical protein